MNDIATGFADAAADWLADATAYAADPLAALQGFGLAQAMADATPIEQAAIASAVGLARGEALAAGPLIEAVAAEACGVSGGTGATLAAVDAQRRSDAPEAPRRVPYADVAERLLADIGQDSAPRLAVVDISALRGVRLDAQADGTMLGHVELEATTPVHEVLAGPEALAAVGQLRDLLLVSTSARLIGVSNRCLRVAREHLGTRVQFGKTLSAFQVLQHGVVDAHIDVLLARSLLERVVEDWAIAAQRRTLLMALKSQASAAARATCRKGVQWMGAMGFADEGPVSPCLKHALVLAARYGGEARCRSAYRNDPIDLFA